MSDTNTIFANPTKDFFIHMLTKDIPLIRAIIDLVDNSVDGALRLRSEDKTDKKYAGLRVDITLNEEEFVIQDNCGGIPLEIAQNYAFLFGRSDKAVSTPYSVGLFGVGMKRAIFKMGNYFQVESKTRENHFKISEDIKVWSGTDDWTFRFEDIAEHSDTAQPGTKITVTHLYPGISEQFKLENFKTELKHQLEAAQQISIEDGLTITLNGQTLKATMLYLYTTEQIKPGFAKLSLPAYPEVEVRIYTGIYERDLVKGGWYLFCNSRLVLAHDQTSDTGWDDSGGLPKYHPDFAYSRGYVYFSSRDANLLPWNTTKTDIDTDSPIFKAVKQEMIQLMRPVTRWLRSSLAEEKKEMGEEGELHQAINDAQVISISGANFVPQAFGGPSFIKSEQPLLTSVNYKVPAQQFERVKRKLDVRTNSEVGRATFDYYHKWECEE